MLFEIILLSADSPVPNHFIQFPETASCQRGFHHFFTPPQQVQDPLSQQAAPSRQAHSDSVQMQGSQQLNSSPQHSKPEAFFFPQQLQDPPSQQAAPFSQAHTDSVQAQGSQQLISSPQQSQAEASFPGALEVNVGRVPYSDIVLCS